MLILKPSPAPEWVGPRSKPPQLEDRGGPRPEIGPRSKAAAVRARPPDAETGRAGTVAVGRRCRSGFDPK